MTTYVYEKNGIVQFFTSDNEKENGWDQLALQGVPMNQNEINVLNDILENGSYREKSIVENFGSIGYENVLGSNGEILKDHVMNVYDKNGDGFQVVVKPFIGHRKGDITN